MGKQHERRNITQNADGMCKQCGHPMKPLIVPSSPDKSEFYCARCDKSYFMTEQAFKVHAQRVAQRFQGQQQK